MPVEPLVIRTELLRDHVTAYIDATASAATRSREIIIIMTTASILIFGAFWNSRQGGWFNRRVEATRDAMQVLNLRLEAQQPGVAPERRAEIRKLLTAKSFKRASEYLDVRGITSKEQLSNFLNALEQHQVNHVVSLQIPFIGAVFDVNDLGLLGGVTLVILVIWLRFALWRELHNLSLTFNEATFHHEPRLCYELLSMRQLLTVPPTLAHHETIMKAHVIWSFFARAIIAIPWLVHALVVGHDLDSLKWGMTVSPMATATCTAVSILLNFILAAVTLSCFALATRVERRWRAIATLVEKAPRD